MTGILIATHHNLAGAFLETVEMIAGKHDFVESVGLCAGQDPEDFGRLIADKIEQFHQRGYQEVVVMLDLFGGTPCNQTIRLLRTYPLQVVVGVNLPMILQAVLSNREDVTAQQLIAMAVENGRSGTFDACARIQSLTEEE